MLAFIPFKLHLDISRDPALFERDHKKALRTASRHIAEYHHAHHVPKHFAKGADTRYGYARRKSKAWVGLFENLGIHVWSPGEPRNQPYQFLKDRAGLPPLVLSGQMRQMATTMHSITATSTNGAKLSMPVPNYAGGKTGRLRVHPGQTRPTDQQFNILARQAEMQTISPDEGQVLEKEMRDNYAAYAHAPGQTHPKRLTKGCR